ncbi:hypothetical protein CI109_101187 [Kwoniella shandongensis]|uniref:Coupling of ubiquitin conjugation to ER degradation protein 1 n=1 Tax=Kwoniella shandongensis TaxID=1734106 RepID=A0A5M6BTS7_9TREE|nr:uncharacterized protein CI109_005495 [Kwoniella shandongensis]KAA5526217.1 hypothetical protein CI109_005495 [Kwoniella shandongensis]
MEDILPTLIIIGVIYLFVRWLTGSKTGDTANGGVIRGVTPAMVETVHSAFPHVPVPNIIYHLSRTRSAQATSEEILERGGLQAPPPTFNIPASLLPPSTAPIPAITAATAGGNGKSTPAKTQSLIDRYNLSSRVPSRKGKEKDVSELGVAPHASSDEGASAGAGGVVAETEAQKKSNWEDSREKRELGLKERKERMILEARRRLLEKQAKEQEAATTETAA